MKAQKTLLMLKTQPGFPAKEAELRLSVEGTPLSPPLEPTYLFYFISFLGF
jgi:hypothetical protein